MHNRFLFTSEASVSADLIGFTAPILLTTATTIAGLLPLAFSPSTLWPPMAWAMISGLAASTVLTLLGVPALYLLCFTPRRGAAHVRSQA